MSDGDNHIFLNFYDDEIDECSDLVYIKHLPKNKLLYHLWESAKIIHYFKLVPNNIPICTISNIDEDILYMNLNKRDIELTTYYGRALYVNLSNDYMDTFAYDMHNGRGTCKKIIQQLKKEELQKSIMRFYLKY
jgi:hypothetical protein